jgi:hypothetical protein
MKMYSYVITRDYGFAPNPFGGLCTLATCKPSIRKIAQVNDWVIATGPITSYNKPGYLFYAMEVEEKLTYNQYWSDDRFQFKKPLFNGSLKQCFGDNIYYLMEDNAWHQQNSHHSHENGVVNIANLKTDTSSQSVLISSKFYYWGRSNVELPEDFKKGICNNVKVPTYKVVDADIAKRLIIWIEENYEKGIMNDPMEFENGFKRFKG